MRSCAVCRCLTRSDEDEHPYVPFGIVGSDGLKPRSELLDEASFSPKQVVFPEDPGEALALASVAPGCLPDAVKYLKRLRSSSGGDPLKFIGKEGVDRVTRFEARYAEFKEMLRPNFEKDEWITGRNDDIDLHFAYRTNGENLEAICIRDYIGVDAVQAVVGFAEVDFVPLHTRDVISSSAISELADLSLWHQLKELEDNVMQMELVNALDDDIGAISTLFYSCPDGSRDFPFTSVPAPLGTRFRSESFRQHVTFTPIPCRATPAFRLHYAFKIPMPDTIQSYFNHMPTFMRTRLMRPVFSVFPEHFAKFLAEHQDKLRQRELTSVHSPFYALCRARLERKEREAKNPDNDPWALVSAGLPANWADAAD
eukprot:gnl/TRDRNA2_/TRDRNA2_197346_c0_seq1.p1 gnl/TRDRNA2_/TRDRNA2_197346_c0~~gnl/TRDRNA2_/TRDRNA2_197346_c0_seq1.p1  ORF type:complete len:369 (+),score=68.45 gnl/TRDRNA2_/TRDRNA2_197346_c0_seq1:171-1277(+)